MTMDILHALRGGFAASVIWFAVGGALYMNPVVARIYKEAEVSPALKKWPVPQYVMVQYLGTLAQCLMWAFVFSYIKTSLPEAPGMKTFVFGLILTATKNFPRLFDMWIQSTYPGNLLAIEFINGSIGSFIIGGVFAHLL